MGRFYKRSRFTKNGQSHMEEVFYLHDGTEITYYQGNYESRQTQKTYLSNHVLLTRDYDRSNINRIKIQYLHKDHLGSIVAITDDGTTNGSGLVEQGFEPFGARRHKDWTRQMTVAETIGMLSKSSQNTTRGFTGHEHLDRTGFIHMNGRVYDPTLGRFITPDPLVQAPTFSQSYNRYSYVWNNPLALVDPSGYSANPYRLSPGPYGHHGGGGPSAYQQQVQRMGRPANTDVAVNASVSSGQDSEGSIHLVEGSAENAVLQNVGSEVSQTEDQRSGYTQVATVGLDQSAHYVARLKDFNGDTDAMMASQKAAVEEYNMDLLAAPPGVAAGARVVSTVGKATGVSGKVAKFFKKLFGKRGAGKYKTRFFKGDEAVQHFERHGSEIMKALGKNSYNLKNYVDDANHVVKNGTFVPELNGFIRLIGGKGSAKYGFVGLDRASGNLTTFHVKTVRELSKNAPSLGLTK